MSHSYYPIAYAYGKLGIMTLLALGLYLVAVRINLNITLGIQFLSCSDTCGISESRSEAS